MINYDESGNVVGVCGYGEFDINNSDDNDNALDEIVLNGNSKRALDTSSSSELANAVSTSLLSSSNGDSKRLKRRDSFTATQVADFRGQNIFMDGLVHGSSPHTTANSADLEGSKQIVKRPFDRTISDFPVCLEEGATPDMDYTLLTQSQLFVLYQSEISSGLRYDHKYYSRDEILSNIRSARPFTGVSNSMLDCVLGSPLTFVTGEQASPFYASIFEDELAMHLSVEEEKPAISQLDYANAQASDIERGERWDILNFLNADLHWRLGAPDPVDSFVQLNVEAAPSAPRENGAAARANGIGHEELMQPSTGTWQSVASEVVPYGED